MSEDLTGTALASLWRRFQMARLLFPRLGECQVSSPSELSELATYDPYRGCLDRRQAITIAGTPPSIPLVQVSLRNTTRRLVFWFESYLPVAVRQRNARNQRKLLLEIRNALGVLEGAWAEPLATRAETKARLLALEPATEGQPGLSPFAMCCQVAERARQRAFPAAPPAPVIGAPVLLNGGHPIVLLPKPETPWPEAALHGKAVVATPAVFQLILETHNPFLWLGHGGTLANLGFTPPSRRAWIETCIRHTSGENARLPGFVAKSVRSIQQNLQLVAQVLDRLESGAPMERPVDAASIQDYTSVSAYYRDGYEAHFASAMQLRKRAMRLLSDC
ncbi:MAG: hypothetical protein IPP47_23380 [Bryobacterales bacterium]|nr:hypothetical protein [Bryobacterales bacterium]